MGEERTALSVRCVDSYADNVGGATDSVGGAVLMVGVSTNV